MREGINTKMAKLDQYSLVKVREALPPHIINALSFTRIPRALTIYCDKKRNQQTRGNTR